MLNAALEGSITVADHNYQLTYVINNAQAFAIVHEEWQCQASCVKRQNIPDTLYDEGSKQQHQQWVPHQDANTSRPHCWRLKDAWRSFLDIPSSE